MQNIVSVGKQVKKAYTDTGIVFFLIGVTEVFCIALKDFGLIGDIVGLISSVVMLIALLLLFRTMKAEKEVFDELAEENLLRAKAETTRSVKRTLIYLLLVACILDVVDVLDVFHTTLNYNLTPYELLKPLIYTLIGYIDVSIGYYFKKYEEE